MVPGACVVVADAVVVAAVVVASIRGVGYGLESTCGDTTNNT